jgi:hypothetical protein
MTIGELIDALRKCEKNTPVFFDFPSYRQPDGIISYRGYYDQPAISFVAGHWDDEDKKAHAFADQLERELKETHCGYKGGDYKYTRDDTPFVANYGETSGVIVAGVLDEGYRATIITKHTQY